MWLMFLIDSLPMKDVCSRSPTWNGYLDLLFNLVFEVSRSLIFNFSIRNPAFINRGKDWKNLQGHTKNSKINRAHKTIDKDPNLKGWNLTDSYINSLIITRAHGSAKCRPCFKLVVTHEIDTKLKQNQESNTYDFELIKGSINPPEIIKWRATTLP